MLEPATFTNGEGGVVVPRAWSREPATRGRLRGPAAGRRRASRPSPLRLHAGAAGAALGRAAAGRARGARLGRPAAARGGPSYAFRVDRLGVPVAVRGVLVQREGETLLLELEAPIAKLQVVEELYAGLGQAGRRQSLRIDHGRLTMVQESMESMAVSKFKATCLAVLQRVKTNGSARPHHTVREAGRRRGAAAGRGARGRLDRLMVGRAEIRATSSPRCRSTCRGFEGAAQLMLLLDTHVWFWSLAAPDPRLGDARAAVAPRRAERTSGCRRSASGSCWCSPSAARVRLDAEPGRGSERRSCARRFEEATLNHEVAFAAAEARAAAPLHGSLPTASWWRRR